MKAEAPIAGAGIRVGLQFDLERTTIVRAYLCPGTGDDLCFLADERSPNLAHPIPLGKVYAAARDRLLGWIDLLGTETRRAIARLDGSLAAAFATAPTLRPGALGTLGDWIEIMTPLHLPNDVNSNINLRWTVGVDVLVGELQMHDRRLFACGLPLCADPVDAYMATQEPIAGVTTLVAARRAIVLKLEEWRVELAMGAALEAPKLASGLAWMLGVDL